MFDAFIALNNLAIWKDGSSRNCVIRVTARVSEIQRFSLFKDTYHDITVYVFSRSLSRIQEFRWDQERFAESKRQIAFHESESHPSAFVLPEICYRGIRRSLHFAPLKSSESSVSSYNKNTRPRRNKGSVLAPFLFCLVSPLLGSYGLWNVQNGPYLWRWALLLFNSLTGFDYFVGVFFKVIMYE